MVQGSVQQISGPEPHEEVCVQRLMEPGLKALNLKPPYKLCDISAISSACWQCNNTVCHLSIIICPLVITHPSILCVHVCHPFTCLIMAVLSGTLFVHLCNKCERLERAAESFLVGAEVLHLLHSVSRQ